MKVRWSVTASLCFVLGIALVSPGSAQTLDLTGSWGASHSCKFYTPNTVTKIKDDTVSVSITQSGTDLNVQFLNGALFGVYNGAEADGLKPLTGSAGLISCGSSSGSGGSAITGSLLAKAKDDGTVKMKGTVTLVDLATNKNGSCKIKLYRVNPTDPVVGACPP